MKMYPVIYEKTSSGARRARNLEQALLDLRSGEASFLAIADANPASCWVRVTLDEEDPDFLWVARTDVNSAKNQSYAQSTSWRESIEDFTEDYRYELEDYRLSQKRKEVQVNE